MSSEPSTPQGWLLLKLEQVVEILDSRRIPLNSKERALRPGAYPYYGANGQAGVIDDFIFDGEYALLAEDGGNFDNPLKSVAYLAAGKFWVNNHAHVLGPLAGMDARFIVNCLNSIDWLPYVSGTTRLKLTQGKMKQARLPLPPLAEQRRIVRAIEDLRARANAAKAALDAIPPLLERFRQSVLASAFRGDLTKDWRARHPDVEPASVLLERIRAERRVRWIEAAAEKGRARAEGRARKAGKGWTAEDDAKVLARERVKAEKKYSAPEAVDVAGLPELPDGWCWARVDDVCESVTDGDHQPPPKASEGIPFLVIGNVSGGSLDMTKCRYVPFSYYDRLDPSRRPQRGDILYTVTGSFGIVVPLIGEERFCVQRHIAILRPLSSVDSRFLSFALSSPVSMQQATAVATGTAQKTVPLRGLRSLAVPLPPAAEMQRIVGKLASVLDRQDLTHRSVEQLSLLTESLGRAILAKAFRGELVPQDPNDEPASVLLDRIRAERAAAEAARPKKKRRRKAKPKAAAKAAVQAPLPGLES